VRDWKTKRRNIGTPAEISALSQNPGTGESSICFPVSAMLFVASHVPYTQPETSRGSTFHCSDSIGCPRCHELRQCSKYLDRCNCYSSSFLAVLVAAFLPRERRKRILQRLRRLQVLSMMVGVTSSLVTSIQRVRCTGALRPHAARKSRQSRKFRDCCPQFQPFIVPLDHAIT
jgi:hypothetical protein